MVPYFRRHGTKQFCKKPIRYGFKLWCGGTNNTGYLSWLEPYQNKYMLGISQTDQNISLHRIGVREEKVVLSSNSLFYRCDRTKCMELYRLDEGKLDHLVLYRTIVTAILELNKQISLVKGFCSISYKIIFLYIK